MKNILLIVFMFIIVSLSAQDSTGNFQVLTGYQFDTYSEPYQRNYQVANVGFGYKNELTAIYGKLNLGYLNMYGDGIETQHLTNQTQYELDYWQSLSQKKSTSFWLNYAYSPSELFPEHRIIFGVWQKLGAGFLVNGGVNHYRFTEANATFLNIGLEKYMGRYWVEGKTYFYLKQPSVTMSYSLTGRVFFKDVNFLQVGFSCGSAQDEPFILESDLAALFSYTGHIRYVTNAFNNKLRIYSGIGYLYEEYLDGMWRNRFTVGIGLTYNL